MPNEHRADPTPPPHHGQGRGGSKKESFYLRVRPALHPPERPSPRRADMAGHGIGRETRERKILCDKNDFAGTHWTCHLLLLVVFRYSLDDKKRPHHVR